MSGNRTEDHVFAKFSAAIPEMDFTVVLQTTPSLCLAYANSSEIRSITETQGDEQLPEAQLELKL